MYYSTPSSFTQWGLGGHWRQMAELCPPIGMQEQDILRILEAVDWLYCLCHSVATHTLLRFLRQSIFISAIVTLEKFQFYRLEKHRH